jgi:hypothetical protein
VKADRQWEAQTDPSRRHPSGKPVPRAAIKAVDDTLREAGTAAPGGEMSFLRARMANEVLKAQTARLRLQKMKGELVDRAKTTALVFDLARRERDAWMNWPPRVAADMAAAFWQADIVADRDLYGLLRWRCETVTSLVEEIRRDVRDDVTVAVVPSVARPSSGAWYEGSDLAALGTAADVLEICFYEPGAARIGDDIWDVQRRLKPGTRLRGVLRPGFPDLESRQQVIDAVAALANAGIEDIGFYNYGHLRRASLAWMAAALAQLDSAK